METTYVYLVYDDINVLSGIYWTMKAAEDYIEKVDIASKEQYYIEEHEVLHSY